MIPTYYLQLELWSAPILFFAGVAFHFIYKWSNRSRVAAVFGAVNESLWEHLKIAFWPMFFFTVSQFLWYGDHVEAFFVAKACAALTVTLIIPLTVSIYTKFTHRNILWIDIPLFGLCVAFGQFLAYLVLKNPEIFVEYEGYAIVVYLALVIAYSVLTFVPPKSSFFRDPLYERYGEIPKSARKIRKTA